MAPIISRLCNRVGFAFNRIARVNRAVLLAILLGALSRPLATAPTTLAGPWPNLLDPPSGATSLGPVLLENPELHNIFVDGSWDDDNPASISKENIDAFTEGLVNSDYFNAASQYGVTSPSFTGSDEDGGGFPCGPLPTIGGFASLPELSFWLACELGPTVPGGPTAGGFDPPNDNSLYVVYLPQDMSLAEHSCSGIHYWSTTMVATIKTIPIPPFEVPDVHPQVFAFAVIPAICAVSQAKPFEAITKAASHEIIEAATDVLVPGPLVPLPLGWINRSLSPIEQLSDGEAADICQAGGAEPTPAVRLANGFLVRPYWSNADQTCVPIGAAVSLNETGLPATVAHTATVNGNTVTLPFTDNLEVGSALSFAYPTPVSDPNPGIRYLTNDPGQTLIISAPVNDVAVYTRQFFLSTSTAPSFLAGIDPLLTHGGWHDDGEIVALDTSTPIETGPGTRYRFDHWSGDVAALTPHTSITMTAPKTAIANYVLQFLLTVQTSGLGTNLTHISNRNGVLGTANDTTPLVVWIDADTGDTLTADANVNGAGGIQYFFQGFVPPPPATLTSPFTTTAVYKTMEQLVDEALASGGISGPSAQGFGNALKQMFDAVQHDMAVSNYAAALGSLKSFINSVQSQCCTPSAGKEITSAVATTLQLDALLVYHNALCKAVADDKISATAAALDYVYYSDLVRSLGGRVLLPC
jgi:hypothetical protein